MRPTLLREAIEQHKNYAWLEENSQAVTATAYTELKRGGDHEASIYTLLHVFPYYTHSDVVKRWHKMNLKGLKLAKRWRNDPTTDVVRQFYLRTPQILASAPPMRKRSERVDTRKLFEAYLDLFMAHFFAHPALCTPAVINSLLALARLVNWPYFYYKTYQILALLYTYFGKYDKALDYLNLTFNYWGQQDDTLELALTAYVAGTAHKGKDEIEQACVWLKKSADLFSLTEYAEQEDIVRKALATL